MEKITIEDVLEWAKHFLESADSEMTDAERKEQQKYADLIQHPENKILLSKLLDESSQIRDEKKLSGRIKYLFDKYGIPSFFSKTDVFFLKLFSSFGYLFHFVTVPIFKSRLRGDTANVIINEKDSVLTKHLSEREHDHVGQNVNLLGEVVLGDKEADERYFHYLEALEDPRINYISIKISGIYAQINPLNYEQNKIDLVERLGRIYQQALDNPCRNEVGELVPKFVNLDMEEYKDVRLTMDVFKATLAMPAFQNLTAGIVIQAYLPDAWDLQTELLEFAQYRVQQGGAPLKMRLVKGANLQMESIISSLKGWENPVLDSKVKVDANYLRLLDRALLFENAKCVSVGVASHNFFTIGYAVLLSVKNRTEDFVTFEMLEGMANHLPRVMKDLGKQIILYTPVVSDKNFLNAIAYLVRRLDENTGNDNFLSYSFNLRYESKQWDFLRKQFEDAYSIKDNIKATPNRTQNRNLVVDCGGDYKVFKNEPDTFFDSLENRKWADAIRNKWKKSSLDVPIQVPVQIGDQFEFTSADKKYMDRCQQDKVCVYEASLANGEQLTEIIAVAEKDKSGWRKTVLSERAELLHKTAQSIANKRGDLIGCMSAITGKTFLEGDVEVSEAIDFCRYYPYSMLTFEKLESLKISPKGVVLVIPPWNFPLAIPVGGVAAALAAGNTVLLKPATVALPVAWEFAQCFWNAGVPKDALQVVCPDSREDLTRLTTHPVVAHVILTGGTDTAFRLLEKNPTCPLSAETGGKNAIIVTSHADRDHAILNIIASAFGNAGQKCSACSLLILEKEVYEDAEFRNKLRDAVLSMPVGSVWNGGAIVGPMVSASNDKLLHAMHHLEEGEWWLVEPEFLDEKKYLLRPGVKWGVSPESYTFTTELFGPLLAVVCMDSLEQGIELVNSTEYGLTSGLQSLDETEHELWKNSIEAGNLYINRGITGAIVSRQPFGGMKKSAFGAGIKAGGPNYVSSFANITESRLVFPTVNVPIALSAFSLNEAQNGKLMAAIDSYRRNWENEFSVQRDIHHLMGEQNIFRYLPAKRIAFRIHENDEATDVLMVVEAMKRCRVTATISCSESFSMRKPLADYVRGQFEFAVETETEFLHKLSRFERVRTCTKVLSEDLYRSAAKLGVYVACSKPLTEGRVELLHYLREQSISYEYHRYGSIAEVPAD